METNPSIKDIIKQYNTKKKVIGLLQVDSYFGESKKSNSRVLIAVLLIGLPLLGLYPAWIYSLRWFTAIQGALVVATIYLMYAWKMFALIVLHETERVNNYLKKLNQSYTPIGFLVKLKNLNKNSISYLNRNALIIECYNGSQDSDVKHYLIKDFLDSLYTMDNISYEVRIQNDTLNSVAFEKIYSNIRKMQDKETAKQVLDLIRSTSKETASSSRLTKTLYIIYCSPDEISMMLSRVKHILPEEAYFITQLSDEESLQRSLEYDLGTDLNITEIVLSSYADNDMLNSTIVTRYEKSGIDSQGKQVETVRRRI